MEVTFLCFLVHVNVTEESSFEQCSDSLCRTGNQRRNTFSMHHDSLTESNLRGVHSQRVPVGSQVKLSGRSSPHRKPCRWTTNHASLNTWWGAFCLPAHTKSARHFQPPRGTHACSEPFRKDPTNHKRARTGQKTVKTKKGQRCGGRKSGEQSTGGRTQSAISEKRQSPCCFLECTKAKYKRENHVEYLSKFWPT